MMGRQSLRRGGRRRSHALSYRRATTEAAGGSAGDDAFDDDLASSREGVTRCSCLVASDSIRFGDLSVSISSFSWR